MENMKQFLCLTVGILAAISLVGAQGIYEYCDMINTGLGQDPTIILDTPENAVQFAYPSARVNQALSRNQAAASFLRVQGILQAAKRASSVNRNPQRTASKVASPGATKTYTAPPSYLDVCTGEVVPVLGKFKSVEEDVFCWVAENQTVTYTSCTSESSNVHTTFELVDKYICVPTDEVQSNPLMFCEDGTLDYFPIATTVACSVRHVKCNLDAIMV